MTLVEGLKPDEKLATRGVRALKMMMIGYGYSMAEANQAYLSQLRQQGGPKRERLIHTQVSCWFKGHHTPL